MPVAIRYGILKKIMQSIELHAGFKVTAHLLILNYRLPPSQEDVGATKTWRPNAHPKTTTSRASTSTLTFTMTPRTDLRTSRRETNPRTKAGAARGLKPRLTTPPTQTINPRVIPHLLRLSKYWRWSVVPSSLV